MILSGSFHQVK